MVDKLILSDEEWRKRLTPEEYQVLRHHGTERPHTGCFVGTKDPGTYVCAGCGNPLFRRARSSSRAPAGPRSPSPSRPDAVTEYRDVSYGMMPHRGALRPV